MYLLGRYVWTVLEVPWGCPMDSAVRTKETALLGKWAGTAGRLEGIQVRWLCVSSVLFAECVFFMLVAALVGGTTESRICSSFVGVGSVCFSPCDHPPLSYELRSHWEGEQLFETWAGSFSVCAGFWPAAGVVKVKSGSLCVCACMSVIREALTLTVGVKWPPASGGINSFEAGRLCWLVWRDS